MHKKPAQYGTASSDKEVLFDTVLNIVVLKLVKLFIFWKVFELCAKNHFKLLVAFFKLNFLFIITKTNKLNLKAYNDEFNKSINVNVNDHAVF